MENLACKNFHMPNNKIVSIYRKFLNKSLFMSIYIDIKKLFTYNSPPQTEMFVNVLLAQLVEHVTFNDVADGSNPSQDTINLYAKRAKARFYYVNTRFYSA